MRILLVEDDIAIREILHQVLLVEGYDVDVASDGIDALSTLQHSEAPDLILVDQLMPRMGGAEFLERVRRDPRFTHTPAILLSGLENHDKSTMFLRKPFTLDQLENAFRKCKAPHALSMEGLATA
jgi:two-component system chemotaxis response regulator CheY